MTVSNNEIAREFAERLLAIEAVSLSPDAPFTWASGYTRPSTATIG
ncbi:orotate phosphoribosyltransferase [Cutibacterium acnes JCM 18920]|nr:orotate phosphoribosyltransferase [Cutibacterium acnes JCM 18920]